MPIVDFMGEAVEFSDDMTDEEISEALNQEYVKSLGANVNPNAANEAVEDLAKNTGSLEAGLIGAGRTVDKWVQGAKNIYAGVTGDEKMKERLSVREKMKDDLYKELSEEHGVATTVGEIAPFFVGGGSSIPAQMLTGAVQAGLTYDENQGQNALTGGAIAGVLPGAMKGYRALRTGASRLGPMPTTQEMLSRVASKTDDNMHLGRRTANQIADANQFPLSPAERTGNRLLERIETALESNPYTAGAWASHKQGQVKAINKMVTKAMGIKPTGEISETVLDDAASKLNKEFDILTRGKRMLPDDQFIDEWIMIDDEVVEGLFDSDVAQRALRTLAQKIDDGKPITTADYQKMSSQITKKMQSAALDGNDKQILGMVKDSLDGLLERQLDGESLQKFRVARNKWKAYKYAAEMWDGRDAISGAKLGNKLKRKDEYGFLRGKNDSPLYDAGRLGRMYRPYTGNSGTADRMLANAALFGGGAGAGYMTGGEDGAILGGAAAVAAPHLAAKAYLGGGSAGVANLVNRTASGSKNLLLDPMYQALLGRAAVGGYVTQE